MGPDKYYGSVYVELPDTMNVDEVDYISREITDWIMNKFIPLIIHNYKEDEIIEIRKIYDIVFMMQAYTNAWFLY